MKYIKTFESKLKEISRDDLNKIEITSPYLIENIDDNNYYKVTEKANNWYYKIKYYYRKPGYKTYCFLTNEGDGIWESKAWIEEDKLMIPSNEEIENYLTLKNSKKYNL
jgi:hypothetical protein